MRINDNNGASSLPLDVEPVQTLVVSCLPQPSAYDMADARGMLAMYMSVSRTESVALTQARLSRQAAVVPHRTVRWDPPERTAD